MNNSNASREAFHPQTSQDRDAVLSELNEILSSPHFCNSKRYPALLQYIVENTLAGKSELLKERTLGVEVFDRAPTYDTIADTVVRYTAGEVRKRLMLYYSEQGRDARVRIYLPSGSYIPEFVLLQDEPGSTADDNIRPVIEPKDTRVSGARDMESAGTETTIALAAETVISASTSTNRDNAHTQTSWTGPLNRSLVWLAAAVVIAGGLAAGSWWALRVATPQSSVQDFWKPVLNEQRTILICTGSVVFAQNSYSGVHTAGRDIEYPFVSLQNASAIAQVASIAERAGDGMKLVAAASTPLTEFREHSVALIGGYNNQWTLRMVQPLRFHFSPDSTDSADKDASIVDQMQPQNHWERDHGQPYSSADDYALVA